jgi:hypothetical protein
MVYVSIQPVCSDKIVSNPLASPSALCVSSLPNALCNPSVNIICVSPVSHASTMYAISKIPVPLQIPISEKNTTIAWRIKPHNSLNYDRALFVAAKWRRKRPHTPLPKRGHEFYMSSPLERGMGKRSVPTERK